MNPERYRRSTGLFPALTAISLALGVPIFMILACAHPPSAPTTPVTRYAYGHSWYHSEERTEGFRLVVYYLNPPNSSLTCGNYFRDIANTIAAESSRKILTIGDDQISTNTYRRTSASTQAAIPNEVLQSWSNDWYQYYDLFRCEGVVSWLAPTQ